MIKLLTIDIFEILNSIVMTRSFGLINCCEMKWIGFRAIVCLYRLNWARRTYRMVRWTRWHCPPDTRFEPWWSEAEHATSRSQRLPTILNLYEWACKKHFVSLKLEGQSGVRTRDLPTFQAGSFNHCTMAPHPLKIHTAVKCTCVGRSSVGLHQPIEYTLTALISASELITRYYSNEKLAQCCFNVSQHKAHMREMVNYFLIDVAQV